MLRVEADWALVGLEVGCGEIVGDDEVVCWNGWTAIVALVPLEQGNQLGCGLVGSETP